ncbi:MAG: SET domain-containing protein [Pseudomonadota bacterium]
MGCTQSTLIRVEEAPGKGRGVFAVRDIPKGTLIERVPCLQVPEPEIYGTENETALASYAFGWDEDTVIIALGYGSLYNHSYEPNATYYTDAPLTQSYEALRDIKAGEEITINYTGDEDENGDLHFEVLP